MNEVPKAEKIEPSADPDRDLFGDPIEPRKKVRKKGSPKETTQSAPEPPTKSVRPTRLRSIVKKFCGELFYKTLLETSAHVLSIKLAAILLALATTAGAVLQYEYDWLGKSKDALGHWTTIVSAAPKQ